MTGPASPEYCVPADTFRRFASGLGRHMLGEGGLGAADFTAKMTFNTKGLWLLLTDPAERTDAGKLSLDELAAVMDALSAPDKAGGSVRGNDVQKLRFAYVTGLGGIAVHVGVGYELDRPTALEVHLQGPNSGNFHIYRDYRGELLGQEEPISVGGLPAGSVERRLGSALLVVTSLCDTMHFPEVAGE